jgi:hypothetical protein
VDPAAAARLVPRVAEVLAAAGSPRVVYVSAASAEADPDSFWAVVEPPSPRRVCRRRGDDPGAAGAYVRPVGR